MRSRSVSTRIWSLFVAVLMIFVLLAAVASCAKQEEGPNAEVRITFKVTFPNGGEETHHFNTSRTYLRDALEDGGLIAGEESEFGLYVKTVSGVTLDYATDGMYWALYVNGEYALSGVDTTRIEEGAVYEFRAE